MKVWGCLLLGAALATPVACGEGFETTEEEPCPGNDDVPCNEDPWNCAAGQTCWFNGNAMECMNVGTLREGAPCAQGVNPTCGELMMCTRFEGEPQGYCRQFCVPTETCKACPSDRVCTGVTFSGAGNIPTDLCLPP